LNGLTAPGRNGVDSGAGSGFSSLTRTAERFPHCLKFSLLYGFFDGILNQVAIPAVIEGLFGTDYRLDKGFQFVVAGFTDIPVSHVVIVPV
jgi:hypothetical protein